MKFDKDRAIARLEIPKNQDSDVDALVVDFLVRCAVHVEAVEARFGSRIIEVCHGVIVKLEQTAWKPCLDDCESNCGS